MPVIVGDIVEFGNVRLEVLETPGHTPEGISLLVYDLAANDRQPAAVLTGDTLFIGDVGRPDLLASIGVTADELADMLYDSLHKLMQLPDETLVYPAHGAGSMCGKNLSDAAVSTVGEQRKYNYALQPMSREEFKALVTADQPEAPDYFLHDAILNRQNRQSLSTAMQESLRPLDLLEVLELQQQGTQVVDVRDAAEFAGAHLIGSINIGVDGKYAVWCGTVLDRERPIVVIADQGREEEAIMRLGRIGFDHVRGYLRGGPAALAERPELVGSTKRITAREVAELIQAGDVPWTLDGRTEKEWQVGHLQGSHNIPLQQLKARLSKVPRDGPVVVYCQGGYRSSIAVSILQQAGYANVIEMIGGFAAWAQSQLPVGEGSVTAT